MDFFKGKILSISGVDGCGKSTIIQGVLAELSQRGIPCRTVWLRYNHYLTKLLLGFCRLVKLTEYEWVEGVRVGYHHFHRSKIVSWLFIILTYLDTLFASLVKVYVPALCSPQVILCDRWILDILVDLEVDTRIRFRDYPLVMRLFCGLQPGGSRCFLILRDDEEVKKSRKENRHDRNFPLRAALYRQYSRNGLVNVIDNNGDIRHAVQAVFSAFLKGRKTT